MCISSITYSELMYGVESSQSREKTLLALMNFLARIDILPFDKRAAEESGRIRAELRKKVLRLALWTLLLQDMLLLKI